MLLSISCGTPNIVLINGNKVKEFEEKILKINKSISIYYSKYEPVNIEEFRNGYAKIAPTMVVEYKGMDVDDGRYAIQLGKILESKNVT